MTPASLFVGSPEEVYKQWGIPAGRQGNCKDYAQAVLFFASNEYTNGTTLPIDGGWLLEQCNFLFTDQTFSDDRHSLMFAYRGSRTFRKSKHQEVQARVCEYFSYWVQRHANI